MSHKDWSRIRLLQDCCKWMCISFVLKHICPQNISQISALSTGLLSTEMFRSFAVSLPRSPTIAAFETYDLCQDLNCWQLKSSMACCLSWQTADPLLCSVCLSLLAVAALPSEALFCLQGETSRHVLTCVVQNVHERLAIIKTYLIGTLFQLTQKVSADTQVVIFYSDCLLMITNDCCPLSWKQRHLSLLTTCAVEKLG